MSQPDQSSNNLNVEYYIPGTDCTSAQLVILYRGTDQRPYHTRWNHSLFQLSYIDILKEKQQAQLLTPFNITKRYILEDRVYITDYIISD